MTFLPEAWSSAPGLVQVKALFFILLVLCQELQPVLANLKGGPDGEVDEQDVVKNVSGSSGSSRSGGDDGGGSSGGGGSVGHSNSSSSSSSSSGGGGGGGGSGSGQKFDSDLETHEFFAQPDPAVMHLATERGASPRKLDIALGANWEWPAATKLKFVSPKENRDHEGTTIVDVCAGLKYKSIQITPGTVIGDAHASPVVQLVEGDTDRFKCRDQTFPPRVAVGMTQNDNTATAGAQQDISAAMGRTNSPLALTRNALDLSTDKAAIVFMHGGRFRLCYSPHGSFGGALGQEVDENIVPTTIRVFGISSGCNNADGCLKRERWECAFGYRGESIRNCEFNFKTSGTTYGKRPGWSVEPGFMSRITWTAKFGPDTNYGPNARTATTDPRECWPLSDVSQEPDTSVFGTLPATEKYMHVDVKTRAIMPIVVSSQELAFSLAACYCPNYNAETGSHCEYVGGAAACCDSHVEFIQQIGTIYYWTVRICDYQNYHDCQNQGIAVPTSYRYMRVIPHQKFVVRVDCPPGGGCYATDDNRVKLIRYDLINDQPSWSPQSGCRMAFSTQAAEAVWPPTGDPGSGTGGSRIDYKAWRDRQVRIRMSLNQRMDICYANSNPGDPASWFKVGEVRTTRAFALAFRTSRSVVNSIESIRYVGHPGSVSLLGGIMGLSLTPSPFEGNKFSGKALVNLVSYDREKVSGVGASQVSLETHLGFDRNMPNDFQEQMDSWCQKEAYSPTLVRGPSSKQEAKAYVADVNKGDQNEVSSFTSFSGPDKDKAMTVKKAGVVAICYCGMVASRTLDCESSSFWIFAGRITIQGPAGGVTFTLPTQVVIKFDLEGWGFSNEDVLRIIPADSTCDSACTSRGSRANDPCGDTSYKVGCPADRAPGCRVASSDQKIVSSVVTSTSANIYVEAVDVGASRSQLKFDGDVTPYLKEDDIITLDLDRIKVQGKAISETTVTQRYEAYRLSGEWEFQDDLNYRYQVGHKVSHFYLGSELQTNRLTIPIGWTSTPTFEFNVLGPFGFLGDQGHWTRRNKLSTAEEIKGSKAKSNLKLCWGVSANSGTTAQFYHEAGIVNFIDPDPMDSASVSLTTKQIDAVAPVVISFKTNAKRSEYSTPTGPTMLMLRFLDVNNKLEPYKFATRSAQRGIYEIDADNIATEVTAANMKQHICGEIFTELWSDHSEGFPMPVGCHYSKKLVDAPEVPGGEDVYFREIFITFRELNGIRQGQEYQIVLNSKVSDITVQDALVDIYAMCAGFDGCSRPYQVFEKGIAAAGSSTETQATQGDPQFSSAGDGFTIQLGNAQTQVLSLSKTNILQFKLRGEGQGTQITTMIIPNSLIRIYMWPLSSWSMGTGTCEASCRGYHLTQAKCSGEVECVHEEVVKNSAKRNIIKIKLPTDMDNIDADTTHTVRIVGLTLPLQGFFPTKLGVQLTRPDDTRPHYITSTGFLMKDPAPGQTTGRLVISGRSGYGPKPFLADIDNTLYVRIKVGATLWNVGKNNAAFVTINLPLPYSSCGVRGEGTPPRDLKVFLQKSGGYVANNRGILAVSLDDGNWDNSALRTCVYELGEKNQAIYAGMVFYVALTVVNPGRVMPKTDEKNIWSIKLTSYGQLDRDTAGIPTYDMPLDNFISLSDEMKLGREFWGGNAAVIDQLQDELVQPSSFVRSCCDMLMDTRRSEHNLQVFFMSTTYVGQNGYVIFDAPSNFDFGKDCKPEDLPDRHYAFVGADELQLYRLRDMASCIGEKYPITETTYNRARIAVRGTIDIQKYYGFEIRVLHPVDYTESQHYNWYLWIKDSNTFGLQGSRSTIKFQTFAAQQTKFYHHSWGMYDQLMATPIPIQILDTRPRSVTKRDTRIVFFPIRLSQDRNTSLRICAPVGFMWDDNSNTFIKRTNNSLEDFPPPMVQNVNQLVWPRLPLKGNLNYGFSAKVSVPNFNPVVSANSFFIEFGFSEPDIKDRLYAHVVEATTVNAITNATVTFSTNLVGYTDNRLEFALRTVTLLTEGSGIVIKGSDKTAGFALGCPYKVLPESDPIPSDVHCHYVLASDSTPQISLVVGPTAMAPGFYSFEMNAANPPTLKFEAGNWKFGSYARARDYPQANPLDMELDASGFTIVEMMLGSALSELPYAIRQKTGRNDRPLKSNSLIFEFSLKKRPQSDRDLILRAPRGFVFESDCMSGLTTDKNEVFGPNTEDTWPPQYTEWQAQYKPTRCVGEGREAAIAIPVGLGKYNTYVFRIGIKRNPEKTPEWNRWSLSFNEETSDPFLGFTIWTYTGMTVTPVGTQKTDTRPGTTKTEVPVRFTFTPFSRVPFKVGTEKYGGVLIITAPAGFEFLQTNDVCRAILYLSDGSLTFQENEYACRVESKIRLLLYMAGDRNALEGGKSYSLITFMYHPRASTVAGEWRMDSFLAWQAQPDTALDESTMMGYGINNIMNRFQVINTYQIPNGNTKLDDIDILLQFPDPLKDTDMVQVYGPKGFNLIGTPELADCNGFRWVGGIAAAPLTRTGAPVCECDLEMSCVARWVIDERKDPALAQNIDIHFKINTVNPDKTPFLMDNYWKAAHIKGTIIKSSHMQKSWDINPQLQTVDVLLVGSTLAAGTDSDIEIQFTPVTDSQTLVLEAIFPTQFSFDRSTVALPYEISPNTKGARLIINRGNFKGGTSARIRVNTVRLGRAGGNTIFNFITYEDATMMVKKDEKLQFKKGFRLPGLITTLNEPKMTSKYAGVPVKSLFQPRYLEEATIEFELSFSRQVQASERLMITCQGQGAYELKSAPFVVVGMGMIETSVEIDKDGAIKATLKPGRPATEVALEADTRYIVILKVVPARGTNTWRFDTSDGGELPSNTNDGRQQGFSPVERMTLGISAVRNPPTAIVDVLLNIDPGGAIVRELIIIAPPGFTFDSSAGGCGDMCLPGTKLSTTDRATASIASPTGEPLTALKGLRIRVLTPEQTPYDVNWFVEGRGQGVGTVTGWGEGQGFFVTQMKGTSVTYPAVAGVRNAQIAFTFTLDVDAGTQIAIVPPKGFELTCSAPGSLAQISLPGQTPDCIDHPLQMTLAAPLRGGRYSFALALNLPPETPAKNSFNIIIRDQDNNVVDAVYDLPGMEIQNIGVSTPFLTWSKSDPGQTTTIEIGLTFTRDTLNVKAILLALPDSFIHDVQSPTDFQNLNKRFPVASGSKWADYTTFKDRIKVYIDDTAGSSGAAIQSGEYRFRFPVLVPPEIGRTNFWSISLCKDTDCETATDEYIIVSFPIAGFKLFEPSPGGETQTAVTSPSSTMSLSSAIALLAVVCLLQRALPRAL
eukprot:TRINITY_DN8222_c0_g6_i1.p1 TRINITY_DN8222_c0_g6~~TRINITY_DN8222_c0_g6_i1.p1  ORF type:complete len:3282 (-),score=484.47 TRINITY_DN8222_c0_g6_i1:314-10159(-)